ncbi:MAG: hypothetical protein AAGC46_01955 [Solirubrobacteraceae bacterium]|nr:hypothetical protein [Patulibacter sp.]
MDRPDETTSNEVTIFLDGGELYVTGESRSVDVVLADLLGPDESSRRRSSTRLVELGAAGASLAAAGATASEGLYRATPETLAKLAEYGPQLTEGGALRGSVRGAAGHYAGELSFDAISFGPEQALALQAAAVSLALRSAIADVQAAVEAVDQKVSDVQRRVRTREIGEVLGTFRFLQGIVASTRARGRLLDADWDQVAGVRKDLEIALEALRAYVTESINDIDAGDPLPKREAAIGRIGDPKAVAGSLHLILVAEQSLHLLEYLRLERVRTTDPAHVESALADARQGLADQRARDAALVRTAIERIDAAHHIGPLEVHRVFSIPQLGRASQRATDALVAFANASRSELPALATSVSRPSLAETRAEVRRQALTARDGVVDATKFLGRATSEGARKTSDAVRQRARRKSD